MRKLERNLLVAMLSLFLCVQWGPLTVERARWGFAAGHPFVKEVALTFDDGPREKGMAELMAVLKELDAPGSFFLVGKFAERYGPVTIDLERAGHEIENHSYTHPKLYRLWIEKIVLETERCNEVMERLGIPRPRFLRPPGGGFNLKIFNAMRRMGMKLGLWDVNSADYTGKSSKEIAASVLKKIRPGSVILMHSGVPPTVEALPVIVNALRARGYNIVTLRDLWSGGLI